jgi:hypothetical protein
MKVKDISPSNSLSAKTKTESALKTQKYRSNQIKNQLLGLQSDKASYKILLKLTIICFHYFRFKLQLLVNFIIGS